MRRAYFDAHKFSSRHREQLENDSLCGCFYCIRIFLPSEIIEWTHDPDNTYSALCPYCGIDSIIGASSGYPITEHFLNGMYRYWFGESVSIEELEDLHD